ncbi:hypothetical protein [Aurantibacillus circumpalustris]|uniref:hypothetical protein n=1 Tax=Aurantibacillus circumpalustris TaxID=3036359 RepID=UPI00295A69CF|nr:hypothetical protein [Aurantibacillus circumpalustris]
MTSEPNKRPRRNPMTSEEVAHIIAHKRKKELVELRKLKKSKTFKILNVFNVICFFIFIELLFCYIGPCHYNGYHAVNTITHYGSGKSINGKLYVDEVDIYDTEGELYKLIIDDCITEPNKAVYFIIGRDYLLQKNLKGFMEGYNNAYRLFSASPVLLLSMLAICISLFVFVMNLNEKVYNLVGLSVLNFLALFTILSI